MTSDAKIGLLLGLVFIFIIAFVINGLPSFRGEKNGNELTHNMAMSRRGDTGIGAVERQYIGETRRIELPPPVLAPVGHAPTEVVRHEMLMPTVPAASGETMPKTPATAENELTQSEEPQVKQDAPALPKVHVVTVGDNLTRIAQKYYGAAEGQKQSSIERILRANRKILGWLLPPKYRTRNQRRTRFASTWFRTVTACGRLQSDNLATATGTRS